MPVNNKGGRPPPRLRTVPRQCFSSTLYLPQAIKVSLCEDDHRTRWNGFHWDQLVPMECTGGVLSVAAQINLGSFNFHPTNNGGWDLGLGQGVNIFGFGGDRSLQLGGGPGSFGLKSGGGALVGGERVGVDSGLGVQSNGGVDLGSKVNFGNTPAPPLYPGGQFGAFLDNIKRFFAGMVPPPAPLPMPAPLPLPLPVSLPMSLPMLVTTTTSFPTLRSHISTEGMESASSSRGQEAFSGEVETLDAIDGETESVDKLFERVTQRPRELPGLVEFGEE